MSFHFVLKRTGWGYDDVYEALKTGEKTSEWRDGSDHWRRRLLTKDGIRDLERGEEIERSDIRVPSKPFLMDFPDYHWKHKKARFVVGHTKSPMLVADVTVVMYHSKTNQFEIRVENVEEVLTRGDTHE